MTNLTSPESETIYPTPFRPRHAGLAALGLLIFYLLGFVLGGELGAIAQASLETVPLAILAILAYTGFNQTGRIVTIVWLLLVVGAIAVLSLLNSFLAVLDNPVLAPGMVPTFVAGGQLRLGLVFMGLTVSVLLGCLGFIPAIRQALSRLLPFDPNAFVHTIALVTVIMLSLVAFTPLLFLGEPPLLAVATGLADQGRELTIDRDKAGLLRDQIYRLVWLLPAVLLAVGYGVRRNFRQALLRLGLVKPTWKQVGGGIIFAFVLVWAVSGLEAVLAQIWDITGWPRTDGEAFGLLMDFAFSPLGAVVLGITAGLGEELVVRGVLQPRLGILLSNFLFAALHALQYNWDGILVVFLIGLIFGFIRKWSNTTTCAIIHGLYDFIIVMAVVMSIPGFEP